ncbi:transport protein Avl9-domain-containing protein [Kalaharituber pfeilii]|nr:transport protein Avl9-domain-containing protein [Kalaharituber pfeilii]
MAPKFDPIVSIVGFHHARGPEVEHWIGVEDESTLSEWPLLPFMALSDGAHSSSEDFSYFTLKHIIKKSDGTVDRPMSLFGISCTRQLDSSTLIDRPAEVTRSTVQKAVVVITDSPVYFGGLKEKLGMVTRAWFAQRYFDDLDIIRKFQESLKYSLGDGAEYLGLSLRELVFEFRQNTLVLFKCCLLQPKMLFFGSRCERLCMTQFSLLSLIPGLLRELEDCADPELNYYEGKLFKPTSVKTSDRKSLLMFMGMPLQIFGKGSLFGPYTPLQQLDILADVGTKSYVVGSTNSLLLQQKDRYSDILINLDEHTINITSPSLRTALYLTAADRRWIDSIVQAVVDSWDDNDPSRPKTMGFVGSEDYIRLQFEEYVLSMVSSVKCHDFLQKHAGTASRILPDVDGDPAIDFGMDFIDMWKRTENYRIFQKFTDSELFDLVPPKHVMAGGLTMDDVSRRISQQLNDLKLDEKVMNGREAVAKTLVAGRGKLGAAFSTLTSNVAQLREAQTKRIRDPEPKSPAPSITASVDSSEANASEKGGDQQQQQQQPAKTGYFSAWASWAGQKRKALTSGNTPAQTPSSSPPLKPSASDDVSSASATIGSPKVPIKSVRDSYGADVYDAETGIGKGDSGYIFPPYRASLDMHPLAQAHRDAAVEAPSSSQRSSQEDRHEPERKGLLSKLTEVFIDPRKSLPAPPPPEKEPRPTSPEKKPVDIPETTEEDKEFFRRLRKSLPPPPSEIDEYPMLVTPVPAPGPLVAQEVTDYDTIERFQRPLTHVEDESPILGRAPMEFPTDVEEEAVDAAPEAEPEKMEAAPKLPEPETVSSPKAKQAEAAPPVTPQKESRTTRLKARNLIRQYVAQENEAQVPNVPQETPMPKEAPLTKEEPVSKEAPKLSEPETVSSPKAKQAEAAPPVTPPKESRTTRLKARNLIRQYVAQENEAQAPNVPQETPMPKEAPLTKEEPVSKEAPAPAEPVIPKQETVVEEPVVLREAPSPKEPTDLQQPPSVEEPAAPQETPISKKQSVEEQIAVKEVSVPEPVALPQEAPAPEEQTPRERRYSRSRHRRSKSRALAETAEGKPIVDESKIDNTEVQPKEALDDAQQSEDQRLARLKARNLIKKYVANKKVSEAEHHPEHVPSAEEANAQKVEPETPVPRPRTKSQHSYSASLAENKVAESPVQSTEESSTMSKRKSMSAISGSASQTPESPIVNNSEHLKIYKRKSIAQLAETFTEPAEAPATPKQSRRKSTRTFGAEYPSVEAPTMDKTTESAKQQSIDTLQTPLARRKSIPAVFAKADLEAEKARFEKSKEKTVESQKPDSDDSSQTPLARRKSIPAIFAKAELEAEKAKLEKASAVNKYKVSETPKPDTDDAVPPPVIKRKTIPAVFAQADMATEKNTTKAEISATGSLKSKASDNLKPESDDSSPPPLIKRKTIPAVFAQADAEVEKASSTRTRTSTVTPRAMSRTPSPGISSVGNTSPNPPSTTDRRLGSRSRSGTILQGPPNLSKNAPPMPTLPNLKDLPSRGARSPSPTKESPASVGGTTERVRSPFNSSIGAAIAPRKSSIDNDPLSPCKAAILAESRTGPGRIGGGLKDNPFLKNDLVTPPTSGADTPGRKRVGTIKNNPFIKNDLKSPTSSPPPGGAK